MYVDENNMMDSQLYLECKDGRVERVKLLLQLGASPNVTDIEYNISTLAAACMTHTTKAHRKQREIVELLLQHGGDPSICDKRGMTVLHYLAQFSQDDKMLKLLLQTGKVDPNVHNNNGDTALHLLCKYEKHNSACISKAKHLIESGADPTLLNIGRESPLCIAAYHAKTKLLSVLLSKSADPNGNRFAECTPIDNVAKGYTHYSDKEKPFSDYYNCIDILQKKGANINIKRLSGFHPLVYTIKFRAYSMTKYLLIRGIDPNHQDVMGDTALHKAYLYCTFVVTDLRGIDNILLEFGANPNLKNRNNKIPVDGLATNEIVMSKTNRQCWLDIILCNLQAGLNVNNMSDRQYEKVVWSMNRYCKYEMLEALYVCGFRYIVTELDCNANHVGNESIEYIKDIQRNPISLQQAAAKVIRLSLRPNAIVGTKLLNVPACIANAITLGYRSKLANMVLAV